MKRRMIYLYSAIVLIVLLPVIAAAALGLVSQRRPATLGVRDGRLAPCPPAPNSVSSQVEDPLHHVDPLPLVGTRDEALSELQRVLLQMPRAAVIRAEPNYLHAECRSRVFRFVDDVEFLVDEPAGVIHVRSASRVGYSDGGVNRQRVEAIRASLSARGPLPGNE